MTAPSQPSFLLSLLTAAADACGLGLSLSKGRARRHCRHATAAVAAATPKVQCPFARLSSSLTPFSPMLFFPLLAAAILLLYSLAFFFFFLLHKL